MKSRDPIDRRSDRSHGVCQLRRPSTPRAISGRRVRGATASASVRFVLVPALVGVTILLGGCAASVPGASAEPQPEDVLPDDFPIPPGASVLLNPGGVGGRGVVTLAVPGAASDVLRYYERELAGVGWQLDPWDGTDPFGEPASGFIMTRDEQTAAISMTQGGDRVEVQINLYQPDQPAPGQGGGHGQMPRPQASLS